MFIDEIKWIFLFGRLSLCHLLLLVSKSDVNDGNHFSSLLELYPNYCSFSKKYVNWENFEMSSNVSVNSLLSNLYVWRSLSNNIQMFIYCTSEYL